MGDEMIEDGFTISEAYFYNYFISNSNPSNFCEKSSRNFKKFLPPPNLRGR